MIYVKNPVLRYSTRCEKVAIEKAANEHKINFTIDRAIASIELIATMEMKDIENFLAQVEEYEAQYEEKLKDRECLTHMNRGVIEKLVQLFKSYEVPEEYYDTVCLSGSKGKTFRYDREYAESVPGLISEIEDIAIKYGM